MHWNLPSNPVDLEQREGRVHRYKGHAVRKNVAHDQRRQWTYTTTGQSADGWVQLFEAARQSRNSGYSDLVPFWVYTTDGGAQIERHVPAIPLSRDVDRADVLRRSLAVYRMAFGQSRQDDLVQYLQRQLRPEEIARVSEELRIDLTPTPSPQRQASGVLQLPGELPSDVHEIIEDESRLGPGDLERLLDEFAALRPAPITRSVPAFSQLLDEFAALRGK
jgi:hypothetical protein